MPFPWLAFGILMALSLGMSALQYLLRPKQQKGDVFDSKTYHADGMDNSTEIGTPVNVVYGAHKIAPKILNYYKRAYGDYTKIEALLSGGEGVINGWRDIKINKQSFWSLFSYERSDKTGNVKNGFWCTFGEENPKVYESCKTVKTTLLYDVTAGFNKTITCYLPWSKQSRFQNASSSEPGYFEIYNWKGNTENSGRAIDNIEIIQYTGKQQESGTGKLQFTGCRVTKSHTGGYATIKQLYKIKKKDDGTVMEDVPGFNKTVLEHRDINTTVSKSSPVTVVTNNKIEGFALTVGFQKGLYKFDEKNGYEKTACAVAVKWWPYGESWSGVETPVTTTRTKTTVAGYDDTYIKLEKNKNYAWLVDANGDYVEDTEENLDDRCEWNTIYKDDMLIFTLGGTEYECKITKVSLEPTGATEWTADGSLPKYRYKLKFHQQQPHKADKYDGPKTSKVSYEITYEKIEYANYFETTIEPDKAKLSDYRYTFVLPNMERFDKLGNKKYNVRLIKKTDDMDDEEKGVNVMTFLDLQEITIDNLCYPHEALLALKFNMNEKIYGSINNITAVVEGRLLKDVQNPSSAERLSTNFYDIFADTILNKRYGRGKNINLSDDEITEFYSALSPEAAFHDQQITENNKARKRFEVNANIDFKKPLIDLLQTLSVTVRGGIYWDGVKPLCYTDRSTTPVAMFGPANTIPGSVQGGSFDLSAQVNRLHPQFLNKYKDYTQDSLVRDFRDEDFTYNKLRPKNIQIYGITDRWRASKNASYHLRFAKYVKDGVQFQTGGDGITIDIGKTFYWFNKNAESGRILAVASNNITLDKQITIQAGKTYKALVRKDDGTPHGELTVDVGLTGTGSKDVIYFASTISNVTLATCPIYGIGEAGEYYDIYRCAKKESRGNTYEIAGALYNAETYRIYKNDPSTDLSASKDTDETEPSVEAQEDASMYPPNIISLVARENTRTIGAVDVHITRPISLIWDKCEISISDEDEEIGRYVGTTRGEPRRITNLKLNKEYTIKAVSYNAKGTANPIPFETTVTLEGTEPPKISGLQIVNNRGNETEMFGRDFEVKCDDMTTNYSDDFVKQTNENEGLRYLYEVYYTGIPDSVKLGNIKANTKMAYREISRSNKFKFSLENNIECTKSLWKNYKNVANSSYDTYYGNPQPEVTIKCWLINAWGKMSPAPNEITLVNTEPDMVDINGATITPTVRKIKSGLRFEWPHPYETSGPPGYDITHFIVKLATNAGFTTGIKRVKVTSLINVDSSVEDVGLANYKTEIDGLNPETTYYAQIIPVDAFRKGNPSATVSSKPGKTHDDDEQDKPRPAQYDSTKITISTDVETNDDGKTVTNLVIQGDKATETDADGYLVECRWVKDTNAASPPTAQEIKDRITAGGKKCKSKTYTVGIDGEAGTGTADGDQWQLIVEDIPNNWKVFVRAKTVNTSDQKGAWSNWASFVTTKANNASDNTAPDAPDDPILTAKTDAIDIKITHSNPPKDLAGVEIFVKQGSDFVGGYDYDTDSGGYRYATIDISKTNPIAKFTFYGTAGTTYYVRARAYDNSENFSPISTESHITPLSSSDTIDLSDPYSRWKWDGVLWTTTTNKIHWANVKSGSGTSTLTCKKNTGNETAYTITANSSGSTVSGTRYVGFRSASSTTTFSLYTSSDLSTYSDLVVIAKVVETTNGYCNIFRRIGSDEYNVSAFYGGFNDLSALFVEAEEATLGKLKMKAYSGTSLEMLDSSNRVAIRFRTNTSSDPDLVIMKSGEDANGNDGADATNPTKIAFGSKLITDSTAFRPIIPLIINAGTITIGASDFSSVTVNANSIHVAQKQYVAGSVTTKKMLEVLFLNSGATNIEPAISRTVVDNVIRLLTAEHSIVSGASTITITRTLINPTTSNYSWTENLSGLKIRWNLRPDEF